MITQSLWPHQQRGIAQARNLMGPDPKEFHTYIGQAMRFLDRYYGHHKMKDDPQVEEIRDSLGDAAGKHGELVGDLA